MRRALFLRSGAAIAKVDGQETVRKLIYAPLTFVSIGASLTDLSSLLCSAVGFLEGYSTVDLEANARLVVDSKGAQSARTQLRMVPYALPDSVSVSSGAIATYDDAPAPSVILETNLPVPKPSPHKPIRQSQDDHLMALRRLLTSDSLCASSSLETFIRTHLGTPAPQALPSTALEELVTLYCSSGLPISDHSLSLLITQLTTAHHGTLSPEHVLFMESELSSSVLLTTRRFQDKAVEGNTTPVQPRRSRLARKRS